MSDRAAGTHIESNGNEKALVDMTDPAVNDFSRRMAEEDGLRDKLAAALIGKGDELSRTVYLECTKLGDCIEGKHSNMENLHGTFDKVNKIADDVQTVFAQNSTGNATSLKTGIWSNITLATHLDAQTQTYDAPMLKSSTDYWSTVSRPYEKQLVEQLDAGTGEITYKELATDALAVCNGDKQLATLTLANFSKNIAGIERRQIISDNVDDSLRSTYTRANVDGLFHRIESISDSPEDRYNKEGATYHFFGAMLAAERFGYIAKVLVDDDNRALRASGAGRTDLIKDTAGLDGAQVGLVVAGHETNPGLLKRVGYWVLAEFAADEQEDAN